MRIKNVSAAGTTTVDVSGLDGVTLTVRRPSLGDRLSNKAIALRDRGQAWLEQLRFVVGWSGIENEDGSPLPFSPDSLQRAMLDERFQWPILDALAEVFYAGGVDEKNSAAPPAT